MDPLRGAWGHLMQVLGSEEVNLQELHKVVVGATKVAFVLELTIDIFYLRCAKLKIVVKDARGMSYRCCLLYTSDAADE